MRARAIPATAPETYWGAVPDGIPALLVYGIEDRFGTAENAKDLASRIEDSRLIFIEGAGHMAIRERPECILDAISEFCIKLNS